LHWRQLDADLYVPALIEGAFGSRRWMQHIGELGGSARSAAKIKASSENGTRGGRPNDKRGGIAHRESTGARPTAAICDFHNDGPTPCEEANRRIFIDSGFNVSHILPLG
jgi:hypothetical protein